MKKNVEKNFENFKISIRILFFSTFFFKIIFRPEKIIFFDRIFFKVHLLVQENRFEAVPERFQQFRAKKTQGEKVLAGNQMIPGVTVNEKDSKANFT